MTIYGTSRSGRNKCKKILLAYKGVWLNGGLSFVLGLTRVLAQLSASTIKQKTNKTSKN